MNTKIESVLIMEGLKVRDGHADDDFFKSGFL
jgi:hypothetical protein